MKRACSVVLVALLVFPNCAARGALAVRPAADLMTMPSIRGDESPRILPPALAPVDVWRRFAERLPVGTVLRIRTTRGPRLTATLLSVDPSGMMVSPKSRVPEPPRVVTFDEIVQIEIAANDSGNLVKAAAVGAGVGGGVFIGLLMLLAAGWD